VIRDSGSQRSRNAPWLGSGQRWTVSHKATQIHAATMGLGFAWFAEDTIRSELEQRTAQATAAARRRGALAELYLVYADRDYAGPGAQLLAGILRDQVKAACQGS
jgi:DNA-binding transcriptional LysR family regulator